ncbi:MAG TPA: FHA domain-containing protein [Desulfotomaculum sp.]|nr:FHA domain-containing protein [Desulfotomaculum sp.]
MPKKSVLRSEPRMALWLEVTQGPDKGRKMALSPGTVVYIGRDPSRCRFELKDAKVSRLHARIAVAEDGTVTLADENSTNGTFLKGERIEGTAAIFPGDLIRLGDSVIRLTEHPPASAQKRVEACPAEAPPSGMSHALSGGGEYRPAAEFTRALPVRQAVINIGRDPANDLVLEHPAVSRCHARIVFKSGGHLIYDLNSTNGTYVNGKRVVNSTELPPGSLIQIAGYRWFFDGRKLLEYDENAGRVRIEVRRLSKSVTLADGTARRLLDEITLVIEPREFVAVLGASGSGKSTLLGALNGIRPATAGEILINGRNLYAEYGVFRSMIGYVPQEDIVHGELTVEEALTFSARLRMPDDTSAEEIRNNVERVMAELGLTACRNILVRNLSGGQRKRVNIGVELLTGPSLLFLDEPTSGLDPGLEKAVMEMLRRLADQGRTVIVVTHATFNVGLCDKLIFLTEGGRLAFFGTPAEALSHFGVADFAAIYKRLAAERTPEEWVREFTGSEAYRRHVLSRLTSPAGPGPGPGAGSRGGRTRSSPLRQWLTLTRRYGRIISRDRRNMSLLFLQPVLIAALLVMIFFHAAPLFEYSGLAADLEIGREEAASGRTPAVEERIGAETGRRFNMSISVALMVFTAIWLGTSAAAREIVKEMPVYRRERLVNLSIGAYLLSKVAVLSAVCLVQTVLFVGVVALGLGLPEYWANVGAFFLISAAGLMMGLAVSAAAANADRAASVVPLLLVPQIILSGAIVPVEKVEPEFLRAVFCLAVSKWGYELVGGGICDINSRVALEDPLAALQGDFSRHWLVLAAFSVVFGAVSALILRRKDKQAD